MNGETRHRIQRIQDADDEDDEDDKDDDLDGPAGDGCAGQALISGGTQHR